MGGLKILKSTCTFFFGHSYLELKIGSSIDVGHIEKLFQQLFVFLRHQMEIYIFMYNIIMCSQQD